VQTGRLPLLGGITEAQLDELHAERIAGAQVLGDGGRDVRVLRARHAPIELREQAEVCLRLAQAQRQLGGTASTLDVPGRRPDPSGELERRPAATPIDLVEDGELRQEPCVGFPVAELARPAGPLRSVRRVHDPSFSPDPACRRERARTM